MRITSNRARLFFSSTLLAAGAALSVATLGLAATHSSTASAPNQLTVSYAADPTSLDPPQGGGIVERTLNNQMFDTLVYSDGRKHLEPALALSWREINATKWRFTLRTNVHFTDGELFTPAAVSFSVARYQSALSPQASRFKNIKTVTTVNAHTVDFALNTPDSIFPDLLASLFMLPPKYDAAHPASYVSTHPVGTGPYELANWTPGDHLTLKANPSYWQGAPPIKTVIFRPIPDDATRVAAVQTGQVDIAWEIPPALAPTVVSEGIATIKIIQGPRAVYIGLWPSGPNPAPALADPRVRQAMNYAIDRRSIVKTLLLGTATLIGQPIPPLYLGYNRAVKAYPYDPAKAKALLAAAGYPNGFSLQMDYSDRWLTPDQAEAVQQYLAKVGIKVTLNHEDYNTFTNNLFAGKYAPMYSLSIQGQEGIDASEIYDTAVVTGGSFNWNKYSNPKADVLIKAGEVSGNPKVRQAKFAAAEELLHADPPWIYLWNNESVWGVRKSIKWVPRSDDQLYIYENVH